MARWHMDCSRHDIRLSLGQTTDREGGTVPQTLYDVTMAVLEKGLDGTAARQSAIANNIANLETPGYAPRQVSFEGELRQAIDKGRVEQVDARAQTMDAAAVRLDGNGIDLEAQVAKLSKNGLQHAALTRLLVKKLEMVKAALR